MKLESEKIRTQRIKRAWSQEQLSIAAGLSLRTVQRIEKSGIASNESAQSLAAVFDTSVESLLEPAPSVTSVQWLKSPLRVGAGFLGGAVAGLLLTSGGTASALDYTVRSFLNNQPIAERKEAQGDLRAVTVSLFDAQKREHARVRIVASKLDNGNVRFDLVLYNCDTRGCSQVSTPAMETHFGKPAKVEWSKDGGDVIAYEFTPSK